MCLNLKNKEVTPRITKKDIVVYKCLISGSLFKISGVKHGNYFTGVINGIDCKGRISISDGVYFCTNDMDLWGAETYDKLGYKYSWKIDGAVKTITVNGKDKPIKLVKANLTSYRNFEIKIGKTYTSDLEKEDDRIEKGLHSFKSLGVAKKFSHNKIVKCIIPKGSTYYIGKFGNFISYASDKLTYVEIIK